MPEAVHLMGCKIMYTGACRAARPMPGGRSLEANGDIRPRLMTNTGEIRIQNPAYMPAAFFK
jgi:hypothetical protein